MVTNSWRKRRSGLWPKISSLRETVPVSLPLTSMILASMMIPYFLAPGLTAALMMLPILSFLIVDLTVSMRTFLFLTVS